MSGGRLVNAIGEQPEISTVEEFVAPRRQAVESGELTAFAETELDAAQKSFGNVAQRWSRYSKQGVRGGEPFAATGTIATQFVRTPAGWRISSMAWDDERP